MEETKDRSQETNISPEYEDGFYQLVWIGRKTDENSKDESTFLEAGNKAAPDGAVQAGKSDADKIKEITTAREEFFREIYPDRKNSVCIEELINKPCFILGYPEKIASSTVLLDLISDRSTLFSFSGQEYKANRNHPLNRAKGYSPRYAAFDYKRYEEFQKRRKTLDYALIQYKSDERCQLEKAFPPFWMEKTDGSYIDTKITNTPSDEQGNYSTYDISAVRRSIAQFFQETIPDQNSQNISLESYEEIDEGKVISLVAQLEDFLKGYREVVPFALCMACIVGDKRLFTVGMKIDISALWDYMISPASEKSTASERYRRLLLLKNLSHVFTPSDKTKNQKERAKSWNLFLTIFGSQVGSEREKELWRSILYGQGKGLSSPREFIPVMNLSFLLEKYADTAFDIDAAHLYSYSSSLLAINGFRHFYDSHPEVIEECAARIRQNLKANKKEEVHLTDYLRDEKEQPNPKLFPWGEFLEAYRSFWAGEQSNFSVIRHYCDIAASPANIRWNTKSLKTTAGDKKVQKLINDRFKKSKIKYSRLHLSDARMRRNQRQFRALTIECAVRQIIAEDAKEVLLNKAADLLSQNTRFKVLYGADGVWGHFVHS